jgi:hypothetical protein
MRPPAPRLRWTAAIQKTPSFGAGPREGEVRGGLREARRRRAYRTRSGSGRPRERRPCSAGVAGDVAARHLQRRRTRGPGRSAAVSFAERGMATRWWMYLALAVAAMASLFIKAEEGGGSWSWRAAGVRVVLVL